MIRGKIITSENDTSEVMDVRRCAYADINAGAALCGRPPPCERTCADIHADEYDKMAIYALAYDENGAPAATGRLIIKDDRFYIGRVCTIKELRGRGYGDLITRMLLHRALALNAGAVYVSSPLYAVRFFTRYGFKPVNGIYTEENEPRQEMRANRDEIILAGTCPASAACARSRREAAL